MAETSTLRFDRPASYRDRAARYLLEVDGHPLAPRLAAPGSVSRIVSPGEHVVRVSVGRRRYFEAVVSVGRGETASFRVTPGPLWRAVPRLVDQATGRLTPGAVRRRAQPAAQPSPAHLPPGDS